MTVAAQTEKILSETDFAPFAERMRSQNLSELEIEAFRLHYRQLVAGISGTISESQLVACPTVPDLEKLPDQNEAGRAALARTVVIKLNGGLGTGMGLDKAKSLLPVKPGCSFLDVIAGHVQHFRQEYGVKLPLVFMNSFRTEADTLAALAAYPELPIAGLPLSFVQSQVPKIAQSDLQPVSWLENPELEWCPPGHGDIYIALTVTGLLKRLLEQGYEYAYVSNADNMGSMLDLDVLGYFAGTQAPFMMEVADRTPADYKGGHLGRYPDGRWMLRELAQCPPDEVENFQDIRRNAYFNTNNIWWHLPSLARTLEQHSYILDLPLIRNRKLVDPTRPDSPGVYQLETAVGSALEIFEKAAVLRVPRSRQIAVKHWSELITLWSDAYLPTADGRIVLDPACQGHQPVVQLDQRYYKFGPDIARHFPHGIPSLVGCRSLKVEGRVIFGKNIVIKGNVSLVVKDADEHYIPDNTVLVGNAE